MEKWAKMVAYWFQTNLELDQDRTEVIEYSIISILLLFFNFLFILIFGFMLGALYEGLIVAFTIMLLRAFTGGAHLASPWRCVIITAAITAGLGFISRNYANRFSAWLLICILIIILIWGLYYILRYAPVESEEKPIRPERRICYRNFGIAFVMIWTGLVTLCLFFSMKKVFLASLCGFAWQILTLTPVGFKIYKIFSRVSLKRRIRI